MLRRYAAALRQGVRGSIDSALLAIDALRSFVMMPAGGPVGGAARRGCPLATSTTELAAADPVVGAEARRAYEGTTAVLTEGGPTSPGRGRPEHLRRPGRRGPAHLAAQQGLTFLGRTGLDVETVAVAARALVAQRLPGGESDPVAS